MLIWAKPGAEIPTFQLDDKLFKGILALTGVAIALTLREYETGQYEHVEFSQKNAGTDYDSITAIIQDIQESHVERYEFLRSHLVSLITSLTGPV